MRQEERYKRNTLGSDILHPNSKTAARGKCHCSALLPIWTKLTSQMSIMGWTVTASEKIVNKKCQQRRSSRSSESWCLLQWSGLWWHKEPSLEKSQGLDRRRKAIGPFGSCKLWKGRGGTMEANYQKLLWPKVISGLNLPLLVLTAALFKEAGGHGRLRHPAGRSTMWRWETLTESLQHSTFRFILQSYFCYDLLFQGTALQPPRMWTTMSSTVEGLESSKTTMVSLVKIKKKIKK